MTSRDQPSVADLVLEAAESGTPLYLRIGNGTPIAELWLESGKIRGAASQGGHQRLGVRLVATGHLRASELGRLESGDTSDHASLHRALAGKVRRDVLEGIARAEALYALAQALEAPAGQVESHESGPPINSPALSLDVADLLRQAEDFLESLRAAEEILSPGSVLVAGDAPGPGEVLDPEESAVLALADGLTPLSEVALQCGFSEPEALIVARRLVNRGFAVVDERPAAAAALLAEIEAAQDLAAVSAAFEAVVSAESEVEVEPEPIEIVEVNEVVDLTTEPAEVFEVPAEPAEEMPAPEPAEVAEPEVLEAPPLPEESPELEAAEADEPTPTSRADFSALLRELSSIARQDGPAR